MKRSLFATLLATLVATAFAQTTPQPVYRWTTLAGRSSRGLEDGARLSARFSEPTGLAMDMSGNLFVADAGNHVIRRIGVDGTVSTLAGAAGEPGSANGTGAAARFRSPRGIAVDASGNVYVADTGNHTIRRITPAGVVTTLAGQSGQSGSTNGDAAAARFDAPSDLTVDASGAVFLLNGGLRKIAHGQVQAVVFSPVANGAISYTPKPLAGPAVDSQGRLYFFDESNALIRVDPTGAASIVPAPAGQWGNAGTVRNDVSGRIFFVRNQRLFRDPERHVGHQLQADDTVDYSRHITFEDAYGYGVTPLGFAVDQAGHWYHTREFDHAIMRDNEVFAGTARVASPIDGPAQTARFESVQDLSLDASGNLWVQERNVRLQDTAVSQGYSRDTSVRRIAATDALVTTVLPATLPTYIFKYPAGIAGDGTGKIYAAVYDDALRLGKVFVLPGMESADPGEAARFITDIASDSAGNLWATSNYQIVLRRPAGGSWAPLTTSTPFVRLMYLTTDHDGNCYGLELIHSEISPYQPVACHIRRITPTGSVTTIGKNLVRQIDHTGTTVEHPSGLTLAASGKFLLTYANEIVELDANGNQVTIGGKTAATGSSDGIGEAAHFDRPGSLVVDPQGNVLVADGEGSVIRKGEPLGMSPGIATQPQSATVAAGGSVTFSVIPTDTPAPTYQWYFNGSPFPGGTNRTLSFSNARASDAGDYHVVISNALGSVTSAKATLTITHAPPPPPNNAGGGGGGAPSLVFLALLACLGAFRLTAICIPHRP